MATATHAHRRSPLTAKDLVAALGHTLQAMLKSSLQAKQLEAVTVDGMEDLRQQLAKQTVHARVMARPSRPTLRPVLSFLQTVEFVH